MNYYKYAFPGNDLTAEEALGDSICQEALINAGLIPARHWEPLDCNGAQRLSYWNPEDDAHGGNRRHPDGHIIKEPQNLGAPHPG